MSKVATVIATALILIFLVPAASQAVSFTLEAISDFEDVPGADRFFITNESSPGGTRGALITEVVIDTRNSEGDVVLDTYGPYLDGFSGPAEDPDNPNLTGFIGFSFGEFIDSNNRYAQTLTLEFRYAERNVFNSGETFAFWADTDANWGNDWYVGDEDFAGSELFVTFQGNSAADNFDPITLQGVYNSEVQVFFEGSTDPVPTPEPATLLLLGSALAGMGLLGRKKLFKGTQR